MQKLTKRNLLEVSAGIKITASLIASIAKGVNSFVDLGRSLGSAIRRITSGNICKF